MDKILKALERYERLVKCPVKIEFFSDGTGTVTPLNYTIPNRDFKNEQELMDILLQSKP